MITKETGKQFPQPLGGVDGVHLDIVGGGPGRVWPKWIGDVQDLEVESITISLKDELDRVGNLFLDCSGPLLTRHIGQMRQTLDNDPVLVVLVTNPVVKFGVGSLLEIDLMLESHVTVLEVGHSVLVMADLFLNLSELRLAREGRTSQQHLSLVEDMEDIMEA